MSRPAPDLGPAFAAQMAAALGRIEANVGGAREGRDPECLHQLRVGLRRLRAVLQAFRALPGRKRRRRLERSARELTRGLGAVRDWDVLIERLESAASGAWPRALAASAPRRKASCDGCFPRRGGGIFLPAPTRSGRRAAGCRRCRNSAAARCSAPAARR